MEKYILDTNVYIEAHKGYYHPDIVPKYWMILKSLGSRLLIVSPVQVRDEIKLQNKPTTKREDGSNIDRFLYDWSRSSDNKCFLKHEINGIVPHFIRVQKAYDKVKVKHTELLRKRNRRFKWPRRDPVSDQDMYVIATVLYFQQIYPKGRIVLVTKESDDFPPKIFKPAKIPHICNELGITCINDFDFIRKMGIKFDTSNFP